MVEELSNQAKYSVPANKPTFMTSLSCSLVLTQSYWQVCGCEKVPSGNGEPSTPELVGESRAG